MREMNANDLIALAQQGDVTAAARLGEHYYNGTGGIKRDYEQAVKWLSLSAHSYVKLCSIRNGEDDPEVSDEMYDKMIEASPDTSWATYWLGECYLHGHGIEKNVSKAIELWEFSADECDGVLMELANLYRDGIEFEPDYKKAVYWLERAARLDYAPDSGFPEARYDLGVYYYEGKGVERDLKKAIEYFELAIEGSFIGSDIESDAQDFIQKIKREMSNK